MYVYVRVQGKMWDWDAVDADHMGATSSGPPSGGLVNLNRADTAEDAFGFGMQTTGGDSRGDAFFGDSRGDNQQRNSSLFDSSPNNNSGRRPATSRAWRSTHCESWAEFRCQRWCRRKARTNVRGGSELVRPLLI